MATIRERSEYMGFSPQGPTNVARGTFPAKGIQISGKVLQRIRASFFDRARPLSLGHSLTLPKILLCSVNPIEAPVHRHSAC